MQRRLSRGPLRLGQLSSLDLIRGFVAVGRRMSITLAASDLCVTQSAVSRQVRALEELLGVKLLVRGHRSISFTAEGEQLFRCADEALRSLQEVVGSLQIGSAARPVTISCSIGVAGLWLLPRLADFLQHHPKIDVRISASNELSNLRSAELDIAIRYCSPEGAPAGASRLFGETVAPVAHPSVGLLELDSPQDLQRHVLLEFDGEYRPWLRWSEWLATQGWEGAKPKAVLRFNQYDQVIHAAIGGQGVALGRLELVGLALADGRLSIVRSPGAGPLTEHAYWLIRTSSAARAEVDEVIGWILKEADTVTV
jgi:LysR family transcriptional regulator, glycine cleavage system transcriptional activator